MTDIDTGRYEQFVNLGGIRFDTFMPGVLLAILDRPGRWNAMPMPLHDGLPAVFATIADDRSVAAFVMTGEGDVFSSGGDIDEIPERDVADLVELQRVALRVITRLLEIPQPTMAIVNGPAIGFAANLALYFDLVVASEDAWFSDPHVEFGAAPGDGATFVWPVALGAARAKEYLFTGRRLSASDALEAGMVNRVVPQDQLEGTSRALLGEVLAMAPLAVRLGKLAINTRLRAEVENAIGLSLTAEMLSLDSEDFRKAREAFGRTGRFTRDWEGR